MATILKSDKREFRENPGRIDNFRLFSDILREKNGVNPTSLNFDLRRLDPGQYSSLYHFHRHAEELFMILSGSATLRTPEGLDVVDGGDIIFFETGESGAHQLYNHTGQSCVYLDVRSFIGYDICEYPDSGKLLVLPPYKIFNNNSQVSYFEGEEGIGEKWEQLRRKGK